jgi:LysR family transcriptional regulator, transcriptional activator of nhaA
MPPLNYRHLHHFWVVAKEGGFARAAERLGLAVQSVSAPVKELERALGHQLLVTSGRGIALTDAGRAAFARAEAIFAIGELLPAEVRDAARGGGVRLAVGLSDGLSKLAAHALLGPVLATPQLQLRCHEDEFGPLLGELALHQVDLVLAGQPAPPNPALRLSSRRLVASPVDWWGPRHLVTAARQRAFPHGLADLPVLLPTGHSVLRQTLDGWFESLGVAPRVAGEFEDSALMAVFAARGLGVFPVSRFGVADVSLLRGLRRLGGDEAVVEEVWGIASPRSLRQPLVERVLAAAL